MRCPLRCLVAVVCALAAAPAVAQDRPPVEIETVPARDHVYMLIGRGGNIGLSVGPDGAFLIDDQFAPLTDAILAAVARLTDRPVKFVVNTHWHPDHTGGNENLGEAGAIIVAHENVRRRLSTEQFLEAFNRTVPVSPEAALPVITFDDSVTFHLNGDEIDVVHVAPAHTDGDSFIHFRDADVIHAGDLFFSESYPFIDASSGGSIGGMIDAARRILDRAGEDTKIIPGHGPLSDARKLRAYVTMLEAVRDRIGQLIDEGRSAEEIVAARPTSAFDDAWGGGLFPADDWVRIVYDGMTRRGR